jgi:hypothetical protein
MVLSTAKEDPYIKPRPAETRHDVR